MASLRLISKRGKVAGERGRFTQKIKGLPLKKKKFLKRAMASQAKITSFYRPTKPNSSSAAAAKRRKAVIDDPETVVVPSVSEPVDPVKFQPVKIGSAADVLDVFSKLETPKIEPVGIIFTAAAAGVEVGKSVQRKTTVRKPRKVSKTSLKADKATIHNEKIAEETTSVKDTHQYNPSTPKALGEATSSTRKRKMQCVVEQAEEVVHTPHKLESKDDADVKTPTKVRKKLEMTSDIVSAAVDHVKLQSGVPSSPGKQVQFLCMGTLSPRKPESPLKSSLSSPARQSLLKSTEKRMQSLTDKSCKSPAVRSLASLLDKVPAGSTKVSILIVLSSHSYKNLTNP